jgi:uncharacterized protein
MSYWKHKAVLITGGSAGLGFTLAKTFSQQGARVAIVARSAEKLHAAHAQLRAIQPESLAVLADVTLASDVERMMAEVMAAWGQLDVLVNNVGVSMRGEVLKTAPEDFQRLFEANFLSMVRCTQAAAPALLLSRGHIVNIGSLASKCAARYLGAYPASKFPVAAFSQQLRLEIGAQGVHTLLVCPGPLQRDDAGERYRKQAADLPEAARRPGGGVKLRGIDPEKLSRQILTACERRQAELIVPWKAKWLFTLSQLWPTLGDWLIQRSTS